MKESIKLKQSLISLLITFSSHLQFSADFETVRAQVMVFIREHQTTRRGIVLVTVSCTVV